MTVRTNGRIRSILRPVCEDDVNFILSAWRSILLSDEYLAAIPRPVFDLEIQQIMRDVIGCNNCRVACDPENPAFCHGFIVYGKSSIGADVLYCIYVRRTQRKLGTGLMLMSSAEFSSEILMLATKSPFHHSALERLHGGKVIFNPFALRGSKE